MQGIAMSTDSQVHLMEDLGMGWKFRSTEDANDLNHKKAY
jgi:hypothetical protein